MHCSLRASISHPSHVGSLMSDLIYFEDIEVGDTWRSPARTVTESDVVSFAGMTGDFNPLHMDHDYAKNTPFRRPIAHGLLGLSLLAGLSSRCPNVATAAFISVRDWKFQKPIYFGDTVHVVTEVAQRLPHGRRRGQVIWHRRLVNQAGETVQSGVFETLVNISVTETSLTTGIAGPSRNNDAGTSHAPATIAHPAKKTA